MDEESGGGAPPPFVVVAPAGPAALSLWALLSLFTSSGLRRACLLLRLRVVASASRRTSPATPFETALAAPPLRLCRRHHHRLKMETTTATTWSSAG